MTFFVLTTAAALDEDLRVEIVAAGGNVTGVSLFAGTVEAKKAGTAA